MQSQILAGGAGRGGGGSKSACLSAQGLLSHVMQWVLRCSFAWLPGCLPGCTHACMHAEERRGAACAPARSMSRALSASWQHGPFNIPGRARSCFKPAVRSTASAATTVNRLACLAPPITGCVWPQRMPALERCESCMRITEMQDALRIVTARCLHDAWRVVPYSPDCTPVLPQQGCAAAT